MWEWTLSPWTNDYSGREKGIEVDPPAVETAKLAATGGQRVIRGGSYRDDADGARAAYRDRRDPEIGSQVLGFRVLLPAVPAARAD